jgi:hypothetical protein
MKLGILFESVVVRSALLVSAALFWLAGCDSSYWAPGPGGDYVGAVGEPREPNCTDWYAYDEGWHRRHCNDTGFIWCNAPDGSAGSTPSYDAGAGAVEGADTGSAATTTTEAGEGASLDSAAALSTGSTSGADSGTAASGSAADAGSTTIDAGSGASGNASDAAPVNPCTASATCAVGTSCVAGSCQPCADGVCACQRDDDCPASQICDHTAGTCAAPPPACTALTTEVACTARADCSPIYGGMSCTNNVGSVCQSGEANCTCATYSFAACVARGM